MRPPAFRLARRRKDIGLPREMLSAIDVAGDQEDADPGHDVADNRDQTATDVARCTDLARNRLFWVAAEAALAL